MSTTKMTLTYIQQIFDFPIKIGSDRSWAFFGELNEDQESKLNNFRVYINNLGKNDLNNLFESVFGPDDRDPKKMDSAKFYVYNAFEQRRLKLSGN